LGYLIIIGTDDSIFGLAVETSGRTGSVALACGGRTIAEAEFPHGLQHAAGIVRIIDELCRGSGWRPESIRHVYVSAGPGSFTGLRIGITLAKMMALATGARIVAVPTMRVLVENAPAEARHVVIVLDAKRDQIYTARFERTVSGWEQREPTQVEALRDVLARAPRPVHLIGEGIPQHAHFIPEGDRQIAVTDQSCWRARAQVVAAVGWRMACAGEFADPWTLAPVYVRPPEAEERLARAAGGNPTKPG